MPAHEAAHICLGAPVTGKTTGQFFEAVVFETTVLNTIKIKWLNVVPVPLALTILSKGNVHHSLSRRSGHSPIDCSAAWRMHSSRAFKVS